MKLVTFGRAMAPHGIGDTRLVPDDVARRLDAAGDLSASEAFPAPAPVRAPRKPARALPKPTRPAGPLDQRMAGDPQ